MSDREQKPVKHEPGPEGSREHVIGWSNLGQFCSEPNCEINVRAALSRDTKEKEV